jgi:peptidyl-prolyl cis-trans isomerase D
MLEKIREGAQGPWAMIVVALIVLSFVFAGVGSYLTAPAETAAAKVNGEDISARSLDNAYQNERARLEQQFGEGISALFQNSDYLANFRSEILDRLIKDKLLEQKALALGLRVSDAQIKEAIVSMPEFQVGGVFNNDRYLAVLRQAGFQVEDFREYMRKQMTKTQLQTAIAASNFVVPSEATAQYLLEQQTRDAQYVVVPQDNFADSVEVSEEKITQFYQTNIDTFDAPEQAAIAYVELKVSDLLGEIDVTDAEVEEYYQFNMGQYRSPEQRRVAHILFDADDVATAQDILARLQDGEDFGALAAEFSLDTFSGENGGDLDFIELGDIDPAFDDAAFAIDAVGGVSDLVTTESGIHIIKLTDLVAESVTPLSEVRDELLADIQLEKATEEFFTLQTRMAEIAFEVPDTLEDVAEAINGKVVTTELFTQNNAPVMHPRVIENAFSATFISEGLNSDIIELDDNHILVMRSVDYQPERTRSLEEVRAQVVAQLTAEMQRDAALAFAQDALASESLVDSLAAQSLSLTDLTQVSRNTSEMAPSVVQTLFTLSADNATAAMSLPNGDAVIVVLTGVNDAQMTDAEAVASVQQQLSGQRAQADFNAFIAALEASAEIQILN